MSQRPDARVDPLGPYEAAVTFLSAMVLLLVAFTIPLAIFGRASIVGIGETEACAVMQPDAVPYGERDVAGQEGASFIPGLRPDARFSVHELEVCDEHPSLPVKMLSIAGSAAPLLLLIGFLALSRRLIRHARRSGMFTTSVAARTQALGWFLLLGSLVVEVVRATANGVVASNAVRGLGWGTGFRHFDIPVVLVVVGLGIITVARVLLRAVVLQDDHDATI
jgi:hypothetical protein